MNAGTSACDRCRGLFEPLSRQASQNSMGPWFIRDEANPFLPGCSLQTLRILIKRGKVVRDTVLRGPSTRQFWTLARNAPGIANLLGECHACHADASPGDSNCASCGASFHIPDNRERLGLSDVRLLPGHAAPEQIAAASSPGMPATASTTTAAGAGTTETTGAFVGIDDPHEAQAMIAARQRQRRSRQRLTIALVLTVVAIGLAGLAASIVLAKQGSMPQNPAPASPTPAPTQGADASEDAIKPSRQPVTALSAADTVSALSPQPTADSGLNSLAEKALHDLESAQPEHLEAAIRQIRASGEPTTPRVDAAVRAAEARLICSRIDKRL